MNTPRALRQPADRAESSCGRPRSARAGRLAWGFGLLLLTACASVPEQELINTITWATASESDNFGFDVYRAERRDGPFARITPQPIAGGGTTDIPRNYRFPDRDIEPGTVYFYYVESISLSGQRKRFTPLMKASAR